MGDFSVNVFYQYPVLTSLSVSFYLITSALVNCHMPLQLSTVCKAVAALGAAEALFGLLVPILDVLLQGAVTLVATSAVRAGEKLRERIRSSWMKK